MTSVLAASTGLAAVAASAGQHVLAVGSLTARDLGAGILAAIAAAVLYLASCLIWPYGPCVASVGHRGRNWGSNSRRHGRCRVCKGTGERLRAGTRIIRSWRGKGWPK